MPRACPCSARCAALRVAPSSVRDPSLSPPALWRGHMLSHWVGGVACLQLDPTVHTHR